MKVKNFYAYQAQLDLPFSETDKDLLSEIFKTLELKFGLIKNSNQYLIDLGAGDGRVILYAALVLGIKSLGVEINSNLIRVEKKNIKFLKKEKQFKKYLFRRIKIKLGDFYLLNLNTFDFVYIYSWPNMQKYLNQVLSTAKKGAVIVSYKYPLRNFETYLKLDFELNQKVVNNEVSTFFYVKF